MDSGAVDQGAGPITTADPDAVGAVVVLRTDLIDVAGDDGGIADEESAFVAGEDLPHFILTGPAFGNGQLEAAGELFHAEGHPDRLPATVVVAVYLEGDFRRFSFLDCAEFSRRVYH